MKKVILYCCLLLAFLNCSKQKSETLIEFEQIIGEENAVLIDTLLFDFENNFLKKRYPNLSLNNKYQEFLNEIDTGLNMSLGNIFPTKKEKFDNSNLIFEIFSVVDSIWIPSDSISRKNSTRVDFIERAKYLDKNGKFDYMIIEKGSDSSDYMRHQSLFKNDEIFVYYNPMGNYFQALKALQSKNEIANLLYTVKMEGDIPNGFLASSILQTNLDFSNLLNRRLIMLEFAY